MKQSEKQKNWKTEHYLKNKETYRSKQSEQRNSIKEYIDSLKDKCVNCTESDISCLDFHHIIGEEKDNSLSNAIKNKWGKKRIEEEIKKCVVLCSNCHRKLHYYNLSLKELKEYNIKQLCLLTSLDKN